jgi:hypothetical protein
MDEHGEPCGAVSTHVGIVGVGEQVGDPELEIISICSRHAHMWASQ